ncbi:MAG: arsenate reductase ArsC [Bacilli bacterium]|nr:arsenate reductase ArsC [Bacilli bacterium]
MELKKKVVAFVCTHNSCRSIMAEAYMKHFADKEFDIYSAGTEEYPAPKPLAVEVMLDKGVDMSHAKTKLVTELPGYVDVLITMGCGVECPYIPTPHREDWGLDDPSGHPKAEFEKTRDLIETKVLDLIERIHNNKL